MGLPPSNKLSEATTKPAQDGKINDVHVKVCRPKCIELVAIAANIYDKTAVNRLVFAAQAIRIIRQDYGVIARSLFKDYDVIFTLILMNFNNTSYTSQQVTMIKDSIETLKKESGTSIQDVRLLTIDTLDNLNSYINQGVGYRRQIYPIGRIDIFSHGFPKAISLGYGFNEAIKDKDGRWFTPSQTLRADIKTFMRWSAKSFYETASFYSWSCQTGGVEKAGEKPLANSIADHLNIPVYAFIKRSDYAETWGNKDDRSYLRLQCKIPFWGDEDRCKKLADEDEERERNIDAVGAVWMKNGAVYPVKSGTTPEKVPAGMFVFNPNSKKPTLMFN